MSMVEFGGVVVCNVILVSNKIQVWVVNIDLPFYKTLEIVRDHFAKVSPSSSSTQLQFGLSLALFPIYPTTRPDHPTAGIVDFLYF